MKTKKIIALVFIIIVALGAAYTYYQYNRKPANIKKENALIAVTATSLVEDFNKNEQAANQKYTDKIISVTGNVLHVQADVDGQVTVILESSDPLASVTCSFYKDEAPKVKNLTPGQQVRIKGVCTGKLMDVVLNKCSLQD
ncbi:MAG: hypothetical protein QM594_05870 [Niabella sp.]